MADDTDTLEIALDTTDPASTFASLAIVIGELDERRREAEDAVAGLTQQIASFQQAYARWAGKLGCAPTYNAIDAKIAELAGAN